MLDIAKNYIEDEIKTAKNLLEGAYGYREKRENWINKEREVLKMFYEKCRARKVMIVSSSTALVSVVAAFIAGLLVPASVPTIAVTGPCVFIVSASTVVFLSGLDKYKLKKSQLSDRKNLIFAPCDFDRLPNGELCAELIIQNTEKDIVKYDCEIEKYKQYIDNLQKIYNKIVDEQEIEKEEQEKADEIREDLIAEWNAYLEEVATIHPSEINLQASSYQIAPVQLKKVVTDGKKC